MLLSKYSELTDPCGWTVIAIFGLIFWSISVIRRKDMINLCKHAYNDGYYKGKDGDYDMPSNIATKFHYVVSAGTYGFWHESLSIRAWKLGNEHGKDSRPMLLGSEIYRLLK